MEEMFAFFDDYEVESAYVYTLSQKLGASLPYDVLLTCLKYNFAMNMSRNRQKLIEEEIRPIKYRNCLYRMKLAQYDVEVNCTKKKEGRQLAAQKILKQMHPHIVTWGSILRLYASRTDEMRNGEETTKTNADSIVAVGNEMSANKSETNKAKPNRELLEKLREEMKKLKKADTSVSSVDTTAVMLNTLSTIPPLILGGKKNTHEAKETASEAATKSEDGIIAVVTDKKEVSAALSSAKKRKYSDEDDESDTSTSDATTSHSSSGEESDAETSSDDSANKNKNTSSFDANSNSFSD